MSNRKSPRDGRQGADRRPVSADRYASRRRIFFLDTIVWPALLIAAAFLWNTSPEFRSNVPNPIGPVPLGVIWWGALGGLLISIRGVLKNRGDLWNPDYLYWHYVRVPLSAAAGTVGYLAVILVLPNTPDLATPRGQIFSYLVAFLIGFREEVFFELLQRFRSAVLPRTPDVAEGVPEQSGEQPGGPPGGQPGATPDATARRTGPDIAGQTEKAPAS